MKGDLLLRCAVVLATLVAPEAGRALQVGGDSTRAPAAPPPAPRTGAWGGVSLTHHPATTVVSITVVVPHGSADDPPGRSGTAWLTGESVGDLARKTLDPATRAATELAVEVDREWTVFRLVTLPAYWEDASGVLEWALFRGEPDQASFDAARVHLTEVFAFENDAPVREFELEFRRLLTGLTDPWSRDPRGDAAEVAQLSFQDVLSFRRDHYRQERTAVSVLGAVTREAAASVVVRGPAPDDGFAVDADFGRGEPGRTPPTPWDTGDRLHLVRPVTSTWIGYAYPVPPTVSRTALDLLVHRLDEDFNPTPPLPGTFHVDVEVESLRGEPLLVVEAAVLPDAAETWEARIRDAVAMIALEELQPGFFAWHRRRFRNATVIAESAPEVAGLRRAIDLLLLGRVRDLTREIWELDASDLADAAASLGPPRVLVLGPDLSAEGPGSRGRSTP